MAQEQNNKQRSAPRTLAEFKEFRSNNPKIVNLANGIILRIISQIEWINTAKKHDQKDAVERHKSSLMSGYVVADSEALVMQKVGKNVQYKFTEDSNDHRWL